MQGSGHKRFGFPLKQPLKREPSLQKAKTHTKALVEPPARWELWQKDEWIMRPKTGWCARSRIDWVILHKGSLKVEVSSVDLSCAAWVSAVPHV